MLVSTGDALVLLSQMQLFNDSAVSCKLMDFAETNRRPNLLGYDIVIEPSRHLESTLSRLIAPGQLPPRSALNRNSKNCFLRLNAMFRGDGS